MDNQIVNKNNPRNILSNSNYQVQIVWRNVFIQLILHIGALYGFYCIIMFAQWKTTISTYVATFASIIGVTAGAHRLWCHRTYKAKLPLQIILAILQTMAIQNDVYEWVRDHRVHHKYTDTNADPHNSTRGFFFSHMGWLMVKKHKDVITRGKSVDMSDLKKNPVVMFQRRYYVILAPIFSFLIPPLIPWYFWAENTQVSFFVMGIARYVLSLHITWLVNSAAHMWGTKPYDKNIKATECPLGIILPVGEGFHNYHHIFPWDYKAAELGQYQYNWTTAFIDFMAKIGWAYDLKTVSEEMIKKRVKRTGDGTRKFDDILDGDEDNLYCNDYVWGWGDKDMKYNIKNLVEIHYQKSQ